MEQFQQWKDDEERKTSSFFIQHTSNKTLKEGTVTYFMCNGTGNPRPHGEGKRNMKTQGSNKSGASCIAHMRLMVHNSTRVVTVPYCSTHTGHSIKLAHIQIPVAVRQEIACKFQTGFTVERILDDIRENVEGDLRREHLVTKIRCS